jgi:hypothetical protein
MTTTWCSVVAAQYRSTLDDLAIVLRGCPDELWEASIYEVKKTDTWAWPPTDHDGQPFDDPALRETKLQAMSAVWRTAAHALWFTDLDLSTETDWAPPPPFSAGDEDAYVVPPTYSRDQIAAYLTHCHHKVDTLFTDLTDAQATQQLPTPHRNGGTTQAAVLIQGVTHLQLHSTQIRTYLRTQAIRCEDE